MSLHRSFMWHLLKEDSEHMRLLYSSVYGKEIYPVAINDFDCKARYEFDSKARYGMIR